MTRELIARAVVRLYPADLRAARGAELVGTLLDAGEHSLVAFLAQLASVMVGGLGAQARRAHAQPLGALLSDVLRWAAVMSMGSSVTIDVVNAARWGQGPALTYATVLPALIVAMFLARFDRAAGITGLVFCVIFAINHPAAHPSLRSYEVMWVAGFGLMTLHPRREDPLRGLILLPLLTWAFLIGPGLTRRMGVGDLLPLLVALIFTGVKPALAIGTALAWATPLAPLLLSIPRLTLLSVGLVSAVPVAVALAGVSRALARRRDQTWS